MTNDLISRKALVKALIAERDKFPPEMEEHCSFGAKVPCRFNQAIRGGIRKALREIETAPAVDAAPVVHGRWKYFHKQNRAVCTVCSFERDLDANFGKAVSCPNCGAKMDEEES